MPNRQRSLGAIALSLLLHAAILLFASAMLARVPVGEAETRSVVSARLVWVPQPGPGTLGGSGEQKPKPAQQAQLVGRDSIRIPATPPPRVESSKPLDEPAPREHVTLPAVEVATGLREAVGLLSDLAPLETGSRGPGSGPGAGDKRGSGVGQRGGPGRDDGDGVQPGDGVSYPQLLQQVKPNYTADALRAQVQGKVELEIVVLTDGSVGRVDIVRSLDRTFGLDEEAIRAVRRWRFEPGRRLGKAVSVRVGVELSFTLR